MSDFELKSYQSEIPIPDKSIGVAPCGGETVGDSFALTAFVFASHQERG
jgi:hypothetical protein